VPGDNQPIVAAAADTFGAARCGQDDPRVCGANGEDLRHHQLSSSR